MHSYPQFGKFFLFSPLLFFILPFCFGASYFIYYCSVIFITFNLATKSHHYASLVLYIYKLSTHIHNADFQTQHRIILVSIYVEYEALLPGYLTAIIATVMFPISPFPMVRWYAKPMKRQMFQKASPPERDAPQNYIFVYTG